MLNYFGLIIQSIYLNLYFCKFLKFWHRQTVCLLLGGFDHLIKGRNKTKIKALSGTLNFVLCIKHYTDFKSFDLIVSRFVLPVDFVTFSLDKGWILLWRSVLTISFPISDPSLMSAGCDPPPPPWVLLFR